MTEPTYNEVFIADVFVHVILLLIILTAFFYLIVEPSGSKVIVKNASKSIMNFIGKFKFNLAHSNKSNESNESILPAALRNLKGCTSCIPSSPPQVPKGENFGREKLNKSCAQAGFSGKCLDEPTCVEQNTSKGIGEKLADYILNVGDPHTTNINLSIRNMNLFVIGALVIGFLIYIMALRFGCGKKINVWELLSKNLFLFMIIAIFELGFFIMVGKKFIPVHTDFLEQKIVEVAKEKFCSAKN
jgi:hypothetical protein